MSTPDMSTPPDDVMIRLDHARKHYPGQATPAVEDLSLDIRAGEIVALLGPSGCGKTTTLRLINRLIEPTSGRIFINGRDALTVDPDELRRHIGYVIQQVGLFPHMRIAENVGIVPRALGWDKARISERVDELLELVGLDPKVYRRRYPKNLSGGQQQRVGVARALAADPPVLLMDEPFGALDPITRERLQDELLVLQSRIGKTIVLVTHDVAEAVKVGDRIAMFAEQGRLAQYDTPAAILAEPADEYVASFVGSGAAIRRLRLETVGSVELEPLQGSENADDDSPVVRRDQTLYDALDAMLTARADHAVVLDADGRRVGTLTLTAVVRDEAAPDVPETAR
ncbi:MAG TPA: ABC transporter ATP-binding protein [Streptosporangiales bacterium]